MDTKCYVEGCKSGHEPFLYDRNQEHQMSAYIQSDIPEEEEELEQEQEAFALEYHELTEIQANLTHLQNQAPLQQKHDCEKQLRIKKDMSEHKLNVKVVKKQNMLS
jgi:hypothetical protein